MYASLGHHGKSDLHEICPKSTPYLNGMWVILHIALLK